VAVELIYVWSPVRGVFSRRTLFQAGGSAEVGGFGSARAAAMDALNYADMDQDEIRIVLRSPEKQPQHPKCKETK
jgi:hypothetical protein